MHSTWPSAVEKCNFKLHAHLQAETPLMEGPAIALVLVGLCLFALAGAATARSQLNRVLVAPLGRALAPILAAPAPNDNDAPWDRRIALVGGLVCSGWILAYKLASFYGLATTSDLYQFTELATSWLHGHFLEDNCYGNHLSIHTYLFCPILAIFAVPAGAVGLLVALSLAAGLVFGGIYRSLRLLGVDPVPAGLFAGLSSLSPLACHVYADSVYGFHVELLEPAMAVWLAYFALRRSWLGTLGMAVVLLSVKEDAPQLVAAVCFALFCDALIRRPATREPLNGPALAAVGLAILVLPVLLHVLTSHPAAGYSPGSFARLTSLDPTVQLNGPLSLLGYLANNFHLWLASASTATWLTAALAGSFGLILLRPHLIVVGIGLALISWLMQDDLMWAPRFAPTFAFILVVQLLGFPTVWRAVRPGPGRSVWRMAVAGLAAAAFVAGVIWGIGVQLKLGPDALAVYAVHPPSVYTRAERAQADALFATYRRLAPAGDPVIAGGFLARYAHDRNLFWADRLTGRPTPRWILWDAPFPGDLSHYSLIGSNGRFRLYHLVK